MRAIRFTAAFALGLALGWPAAPGAQAERKLELTFDEGRVTLDAQNVTVREILIEWGRRGGVQIVNGERLTGGPVTIQFADAPEATVLASLLRSAAGYILEPRVGASAGASRYQVVSVLPTSRGTASPSSFSSGPAVPVSAPQVTPVITPGSPDDEIPPVIPPGAPGGPPIPGAEPPAAGAPQPGTVGVPASGVMVPQTGRGGRGGGGGR